jgi:glycosyltransferase involved in cell wall biosynthesis
VKKPGRGGFLRLEHVARALFGGKTVAPKVICLHHRLGEFTSHHFNEAHGFIQEFNRREREFLLLVSIHAPAQIVSELRARAVLEDSTFRMEWSFEERGRHFLKTLHAHVDAVSNAHDRVLVTISTQLEAHALLCWLRELSPDRKPWIVILILSDRWNRAGREEYERQVAEFSILRDAIAGLAPEDASRLIFCTLTDLLAEELSALLGTKVDVAPIPLEYGDAASYRSTRPDPRLPGVAILGGTRREKGSYLVPGIVRACRSRVQVEFLVQLANNTLTAEEAEEVARVAEEPGVTVIRQQMSLPEYNTALNGADLAFFPYEVIPYRKRISGVFAEAVAYGKPVVATRGTWMAEQIEAGRAAGTIFEDLQPDSIASAIARCVADLPALRESAAELSVGWRKTTGLSAFVDFMEEKIALRSNGPGVVPGPPAPEGLPGGKPGHRKRHSDCSFVLSVEAGRLEPQAVLLVESLRRFGGAYADCPVYAVSPRPSRQIGAACRKALIALGAQVVVEPLLSPDEAYGSVARLAACTWAERNLGSEILVSLDDDLFFVCEPDFNLEGVDLLARPVDVKGMCTAGAGDPFDVYWRRIAQLVGVDYDEIPWVETTVDRVSVKASYNAGMVGVRRQLGLFQRAEEMFRLLREDDLAPRRSGEHEVFASTGFVGTEASRWWGSSQAVLSLAATDLEAAISLALPTYNVPAHQARDAERLDGRNILKDAVLVHYHWLLDREHLEDGNLFFGSSALPASLLKWLRKRTPLGETYP